MDIVHLAHWKELIVFAETTNGVRHVSQLLGQTLQQSPVRAFMCGPFWVCTALLLGKNEL